MNEWDPVVVRGDQLIDLLNQVSDQTLEMIRRDLGDETFVNCSLLRTVKKIIGARKKRESLEQLETISVESPEFWDE